jgi:hypothetical protein
LGSRRAFWMPDTWVVHAAMVAAAGWLLATCPA